MSRLVVRRSSVQFMAGFAILLVCFLAWWPLGVAVGVVGGIVATLRIERWTRSTAAPSVHTTPIERIAERDLLDRLGFLTE